MSSSLEDKSNRSCNQTSVSTSVRVIQINTVQANRWLSYLEDFSPFGEHGIVLTDFWESLGNACRLANRHRENVTVEIELAAIPTLIEIILSDKPGAHPDRKLHIEEDILATLGNFGK